MNVLIVGLGSIAHKHITALRSIDESVEIYALRSSAVAEDESGITNLFHLNALEEIFFDFVIISNPTNLHQETIENLIRFGYPLFIEKPVFDQLEIGDLLDTIKNEEIITYVACNLRFLGCIAFAKEFISNKRINEVNSYCGSYLPDWRPGKDFRKIYSANKEMGGGVHIDLIHEMDYLYWLFGAPDLVQATKTNSSSLAVTAVDYANYLLQYPSFCASIILNYYRRDAKRDLEILLDEGTVKVNLLANEVTYNHEILYKSSKGILDTYEDQLRFFIKEVIENKVKFNTAEEAFEILKLCIAND